MKRLATEAGLYAPADAERDPGFRQIILRQSRVGMHLAFALAIFGPTFAIALSTLVFGQRIAFLYSPDPEVWSVWAELVVVLLGIGGLAVTRTQFGPRHGRLLMTLFMLIMSSAMVAEPIVAPRAVTIGEIGTPFLLMMLIAVGTMPYRASHMIGLGAVLASAHLLLAAYLPQMAGQPTIERVSQGLVMTSMLTLFCAGISALIYAGRWRQYQTAKQVENSEQRYRSLFENATDPIFVVDNATGLFVHVNPSFEDLLGMTAAELYRTPFPELIDPSDRERVLDNHRKRLAGEPVPMRYSLKVLSRKSPQPITCDLTIHRIADPNFTRGALRDMTEQIAAEQKIRTYANELEATNRELRETQSQLVQSEKMAALGNLVAGVAHEINTPVGSIHANADVSRRALELIHAALEPKDGEPSLDQAKIRRAIDILSEANATTCTATERIVRIVKSLRNFARLDEAQVKTVDIHEGLESTLTLVYHEYKRRIEVVRDYADLPKIECYPNQLNQVFMNILVNAIQAIPDEGTITITTRSLGDRIQIVFTDTGKGIPKENLDRIFDPGFTTKGVGVGTGLGLSIVYKIVQAHRGTITVTSEVGAGTTFTIALPVKGLDAGNRQAPEKHKEQA